MKIAKQMFTLVVVSCLAGPALADCNGCFGVSAGEAGATAAGITGAFLGEMWSAEYSARSHYRFDSDEDKGIETVFSKKNGIIDSASLPNWTKQIKGGDDAILSFKQKGASTDPWVLEQIKGATEKDGIYKVTISEIKDPGLAHRFASDVLSHGGQITEIKRLPAELAKEERSGLFKEKWFGRGALTSGLLAGLLLGAGYVNEHVRSSMSHAAYTPEIHTTAVGEPRQ